MPTYVYLCEKNDIEFEEYHSIMIKLESCPVCEIKKLEQHVPKRLISGGSGRGIVTLSGQDIITKAKQDVHSMRQRANTDEKFLANIVGETKYHNNQKS